MRVALVQVDYEAYPSNRAWAVISDDGKIYPFGSDDPDSKKTAQDVVGNVLAGYYQLEDFSEWPKAYEVKE